MTRPCIAFERQNKDVGARIKSAQEKALFSITHQSRHGAMRLQLFSSARSASTGFANEL
jgi:hypothetical protein